MLKKDTIRQTSMPENRKHRYKWLLVFFLLLVIQMAVMIWYGTQKQGYHADEMFTYGLANTTKEPFLAESPGYEGQWHTGSYFREYLTTQPQEAFHYGQTYRNQTLDVHPPLYYFLFHTVSSFTPNIFTKWTGLITNFICFAVCSMVLYLLGRKLFRSDGLALLPCIFWGFSAGAVSATMYFRMYEMVTCFTLLLTLLDWKIVQEKTLQRKHVGMLAAVIFCGFMTHYYFVIYLLYLGLILAAYLLHEKRNSDFKKCLVGVAFGGGLGILLYPTCLSHIFKGYRGRESWERIVDGASPWKTRIHIYLRIMNRELLGGTFRVVLAVLAVLAVAAVILHYFRKQKCGITESKAESSVWTDKRTFLFLQTGLGCGLYIITVARIAPYNVDRYAFPVFPQCMLLLAFFCWWLLQSVVRRRRVCFGILAVLFFCTGVFGAGHRDVQYLYPQKVNTEQVAKQNSDAYSLVVYDKEYYAYTYFLYPDLMHYPKTYVTGMNDLDGSSAEIKQEIPAGKSVLVYLQTKEPQGAVLKRIQQEVGRGHAQKLFGPYHGFQVYHLTV